MSTEITPSIAPIAPEEGQSLNLVQENIETLKQLFPEIVTENGVDFDVLRQLLGDAEVLDEGEEKFGLNWHGKKRARQVALIPSMGTLRPCPEESEDWDTTQNLFIEGDNLEVLKLLQKSYANQVKLIYIDPPYNTGNEFIYPDRFEEGLETYLRYTGQKDESGQWTTSEQDRTGKKHTNWLNMMYPRLKLARNLLRDDGILIISIDENEHANLKKLCDEIFGQENFCGEIVWKNSSKNDQNYISVQHEYFIFYVKSKGQNPGEWIEKKEGLDEIYAAFEGFKREHGEDWEAIHKAALDWYNQFPEASPVKQSKHYNWMDERGVYFPSDISGPNDGQYVYDVLHPQTNFPCKRPSRGWAFPKESLLEKIAQNRVQFGVDHSTVPKYKTYLKETEYQSLTSIKFQDGRSASKRLRGLFGEKVFTNPKDEILLKDIMKALGVKSSDIVLDFFAGSGTIQHAVAELNSEIGASIRVILVQLPEKLEDMLATAKGASKKITQNAIDYLNSLGKKKTISALAIERLRLLHQSSGYATDTGFRVFKIDSSNLRPWNPNPDDLEHALLHYRDNILPERTEEDVLYELLLKRGVDLAAPIEKRTIAGKIVNSIGYGALFACLTESITREEVEELAQGIVDLWKELAPEAETHVFFRDSAFVDDVAKTNLAAILEQQGLKHVRSL